MDPRQSPPVLDGTISASPNHQYEEQTNKETQQKGKQSPPVLCRTQDPSPMKRAPEVPAPALGFAADIRIILVLLQLILVCS